MDVCVCVCVCVCVSVRNHVCNHVCTSYGCCDSFFSLPTQLQYQVLYIDPLIAACKMAFTRGRQDEDREADQVSERRVTELVKEVFDNPNWESLGHFSGQHTVTFEAAVNAKVFAGKWKKKAFGVIQQRPSQQVLEVHEMEARKVNRTPAFLPGKVLQIDTREKRLW